MRLSRTLNKLICRVLVGVFLFAQLAVAGYACPGLLEHPSTQSASSQSAEMQAGSNAAMAGDCGQVDHKAANLCAEHCKAGQQSHDSAPLPMVGMMAPAMSVLYVLPADTRPMKATAAPRAASDPLLAATPPPHAILHCVFRI